MADDNRVKIFLSCCCFRHHTKGAMHMQKKLLKDLNLLDDFLFYTMTNHPLYGESFSRLLLKIIFNRDFGKLKVVPQKAYYGSDTDKHGARLDVFIEEDPENDSNLENATNDTLQKIHNMVQHVKQDEEVSLEYMKIYEKEQMLIEEGIERGRQEAETQFKETKLQFEEEIRQLRAMLAEKDKALAELSAAQKEL